MLKRLALVLLGLSLFAAHSVGAVSTGIVIGSFRVAGETSTDEFVELLNIGPETINISGWQLAKKTASGSKYNLVASFPSAEIRPGESLVVGHLESAESPDIYYSSGYSLAEDNTIVIYSDAGKTVVDMVGFGKATDYEGKPLPTAKTDIWYRVTLKDTDNNYNDFVSRSATVIKDYSGLCLTEIMPAPKDGDEWIEIYNSEVTKDISGLVIADKIGSVKEYVVPEGTVAEEGKYLVFYKEKTKITLNNDGDGVVLKNSTGKIIDDSGESFGKGPAGYSYAFDGSKWHWSKTPTLGAKNIITLDSAANSVGGIISKKRTRPEATNAPDSKKGMAPGVEVKGADTEAVEGSVFNNLKKIANPADKMLGIVLIILAILASIAYTLYINKEKLIAVFNIEREGYEESWARLRQKMRRWRNFSFFGRSRRR